MASTDQVILALRQRRQALGLSQQEVGELMAGRQRSWICDLEAGRHQPTLHTLGHWCEVLGLELVVREVRP